MRYTINNSYSDRSPVSSRNSITNTTVYIRVLLQLSDVYPPLHVINTVAKPEITMEVSRHHAPQTTSCVSTLSLLLLCNTVVWFELTVIIDARTSTTCTVASTRRRNHHGDSVAVNGESKKLETHIYKIFISFVFFVFVSAARALVECLKDKV